MSPEGLNNGPGLMSSNYPNVSKVPGLDDQMPTHIDGGVPNLAPGRAHLRTPMIRHGGCRRDRCGRARQR